VGSSSGQWWAARRNTPRAERVAGLLRRCCRPQPAPGWWCLLLAGCCPSTFAASRPKLPSAPLLASDLLSFIVYNEASHRSHACFCGRNGKPSYELPTKCCLAQNITRKEYKRGREINMPPNSPPSRQTINVTAPQRTLPPSAGLTACSAPSPSASEPPGPDRNRTAGRYP
jgi:hypothetical protein